MKKWMRRAMAMMVAMMLAAGAVAVAEKETPSEGYRLPTIKVRPTEAPDTQPQPTEEPDQELPVLGNAVVVLSNAGSSLNIRAEASKDADKVGKLSNGEEVYILGTSGDWTCIRTMDGIEGYVMTRYLQEEPVAEPTEEPAVEPTEEPAVEPTEEPAVEPTEEPAVEPTEEPAVEPTEEPAEEPAVEPTEEPAVEPTEEPAVEPTEEPAVEPTEEPAVEPTELPVLDEGLVEDDGVIGEDEWLLDAEGNPVLDLNGEPIPAGEYQVDEAGNPIFDENGKPIPVEAEEVEEGLRQITVVLKEGETELPLQAEPSETSEVLAMIPAGELLYVKEITPEWSYAVYGELEGYVLTAKIALYNGETTPEEEEIIRTIKVVSSLAGQEEVYEGTRVTLTATLTGFENDDYTMQWQYTPDGGQTVVDIEGANDSVYAYDITLENADYMWRLCVTLQDEEPDANE